MTPINSIVLCELLKALSTEVTTKTLPYLLVFEPGDENGKHILYGHNNGENYVAYWPDPKTWYENTADFLKDNEYYLTEAKEKGLTMLFACCPSCIDDLSSLSAQFMKIFNAVFENEYQKNTSALKKVILSTLEKFDVPEENIRHIEELGSYKEISQYLVNLAQNNKGMPIPKVTEMRSKTPKKSKGIKIATHNNTNSSRSSLKSLQPIFATDSVQYLTYSALQALGLTAMDVSEQLLENDCKNFGDIGAHQAQVDTWAQHIASFPENWGFLCRGTEIIGDWSCTFLTGDQELALRQGEILGKELTADRVASPVATSDGEVAVHLLALSLNDGYQTEQNWTRLWSAFGERLHNLAKNGVFYRSISTCLFPEKNNGHIVRMFEDMGFKELTPCAEKGIIYWLDLTYGIPEAFQRILPDTSLSALYEEHWGAPITFRQLSSADASKLTQQKKLDISTLIFGTDRYIYESMMSREQSKRILPLVFSSKKDVMFNLDNLFVAEARDRIIGLILHKKGKLEWSAKYVKQIAEFLGEKLPDSLANVEAEYFTRYNIDENTRSVINFCVNSNWCTRDIQVGIDLMSAFVESYGSDKLWLYVLQETLPEMQVYLDSGFIIDDLCNGWSRDNRDLPCAILVRPADYK